MNWKLVRFKKENGLVRGHLYLDGKWVSDTYERYPLVDVGKHRMYMIIRAGTLDTMMPAVLSVGSWRYISSLVFWRRGDFLPISRTFSGDDLNTEANQHIFEDIKVTCKNAWNRDENMYLDISIRESMGPV